MPIPLTPNRILVPLAILLGALGAGRAEASRGVENYPKVALYTMRVGEMNNAQLDTLAWYDMALMPESPFIIGKVRQRNPDMTIYFPWMPQNIVKWSEDETFWYPDTTWSLVRLSQFYAQENDWFLRDTSGHRIPEWDGYAANWTRYCPQGTYGTSVGKTYVEWLVEVAIPQIVYGNAAWEPWGEGSSAYQGIMFEVLADCVGSWSDGAFALADPDQDGLPEGVDDTCSLGGDADSLSILYREMNELFWEGIQPLRQTSMKLLINGGHDFVNPWWQTRMNGIKIEGWRSLYSAAWQDWWDWFYGLKDFNGVDLWGPGYQWAENLVSAGGSGADNGWDQSILQVYPKPGTMESKAQRLKRWGLGTTLLGDGYFSYTWDQRGLRWQPEYEWDFGDPMGGYFKQTYAGPGVVDTLYVRTFTKGFVEVNPHPRPVNGVAAEDSRFGFWQTVSGLQASAQGPNSVRVTFTAPAGQPSPVEQIELRYSTQPITAGNWTQASPYPGNPLTPAPGTYQQIDLNGLQPGILYYCALRNRVHGRQEPGISNLASAQTDNPLPDTTPPAPITDLRVNGEQATYVYLAWTATGDDGLEGTASSYLVRFREGAAIETEEAWSSAVVVPPPLPTPLPSGAPQQLIVSGLEPGTLYGFCIRALDESQNLSGLSNSPLALTTEAQPPPPPPDTTAPAAVTDLEILDQGETWVDLAWTAAGDDSLEGTAAAVEIRARPGGPITKESEWLAALLPPGSLPAPLPGGTEQTFRFEGLAPGTLYGFAVRFSDESGNVGNLSNSPQAFTDDPPPQPLAPPAIEDLAAALVDSVEVLLQWTAPHDGAGAAVASYRIYILQGDSIRNQDDLQDSIVRDLDHVPAAPGAQDTLWVRHLTPSTLYGFCLQSLNGDGLVSEPGNYLHLRTLDRPDPPDPPDPPPPPLEEVPPAAITDLRAAEAGPSHLLLAWTAVGADSLEGQADSYEIRLLPGRAVESEDDWEEAAAWSGETPRPRQAGEADSVLVNGLEPDSLYGLCVRALDGDGLRSGLSNALAVRTASAPALPDTIPPAVVDDLAVLELRPESILLEWSPSGDDGHDGRASHYLVGLLEGSVLETEAAWLQADTVRVSDPDRTTMEVRLTQRLDGLRPATQYGLAVRASDQEGNLSPLAVPGLLVVTPAWADTIPPIRITDLDASGSSQEWVDLAWTAPADSVSGLVLARYVLGYRPDLTVMSEADWSACTLVDHGLPVPAEPGTPQSWRLSGLEAGASYGVALRGVDEAGNLGLLSRPLLVTTLDPPDEPPDTSDAPPDTTDVPVDPRPAPVEELTVLQRGETWVELSWRAVGEDSLNGTAAAYRLRYSAAGPVQTEEAWSQAEVLEAEIPPLPSGQVMTMLWSGLAPSFEAWVAVRAEDQAGQLSAPAGGARIGPFADPVPTPPPALEEIWVRETLPRQVELAFLHPEPAPEGAPLDHYVIGLSPVLINEALWPSVSKAENPPSPAAPGTEARLGWDGLEPGREYFAAARVVDQDGLESPLSPVLSFWTMEEQDLAPPEPPGSPQAVWNGPGIVRLEWPPSSDPRVIGYRVYGQGPEREWRLLTESLLTATFFELQDPDPDRLRRLAVCAVSAAGVESPFALSVEIFGEGWQILGPFPHPVRDRCRVRIQVPASAGTQASLRVEILTLMGERAATLHQGAVHPGVPVELQWDRRTESGGRAGPGFYYLLVEGAGRRELKTIYLAP